MVTTVPNGNDRLRKGKLLPESPLLVPRLVAANESKHVGMCWYILCPNTVPRMLDESLIKCWDRFASLYVYCFKLATNLRVEVWKLPRKTVSLCLVAQISHATRLTRPHTSFGAFGLKHKITVWVPHGSTTRRAFRI